MSVDGGIKVRLGADDVTRHIVWLINVAANLSDNYES